MKKIALIALVPIFLVIGGAWYFFGMRSDAPAEKVPEVIGIPQETVAESAPNVPEGWRKYANTQYGFALFVPPELSVVAFNEGEGAHTLTFESSDGRSGFQIFVVPYSESTITEERFRQDAPSGVMKERMDVVIDGITAAAFFSEHSLMGETREVWFLHDGYLFEVTTYKELDTWLAEIMRTWRFVR